MAESFDPYLRWLGIRDPERPPNHYRLLGLALFESDSDVIAVAADRQMAHVRTFQAGQNGAASQRLLNELAAARVALLKPDTKAVYDEQLRQRQAAESADQANLSGRSQAVVEPAAPSAVVEPPEPTADFAHSPSYSGGRRRTPPAINLPVLVGLGAGALAIVVFAIVWQTMSGDRDATSTDRQQVAASGESHRPALPTGSNAPADSRSLPPPNSPREAPKHSAAPPTVPATAASPNNNVASEPKPAPIAAALSQPPSSSPSPVAPAADVATKPAAVATPATSAQAPTAVSPPSVPASAGGEQPDKAVTQSDAAPKTPATAGPPPPSAPDPGTSEPSADSKPDQPPTTPPAGSPAPAAAATPPAVPARVAIPSKEAQDKAEKEVQSIFKSEFDQAAHGTAAAKLALSQKLVQQAGESADDPAARYVLLVKAEEFARDSGDLAQTMAAVNKLAQSYLFDASSERFTTLTGMLKSLKSPEATQAALDAATAAIDEAIAADNYDAASKFARLASGLASKSRNQPLSTQLKNRSLEIDQVKKEYAKTADALEKLKTAPDDPEANFAVGYFQGPLKGDFDKALPALAKGSDATLQDLAKRELASPTDSAELAKLADGWWALADDKHEPAKGHLRAHAVVWYNRALADLKGLPKAQAESRVKQVENENTTPAAANRAALVKFLTEGEWQIQFAANPKARRSPGSRAVEYRMRFFEDGTLRNQFTTGKWTLAGDVVTVTYDNRPPDELLQKYQIQRDSLRCETYSRDALQATGVGTKIR